VNVSVEKSARPRDEELSAFLLQASRELLFNVVKHAGVDSASLHVCCDEDEIAMTVADQGRGFDPSAAQSMGGAEGPGAGLTGIRRRVELLGGTMEVSSAPGEGAQFLLRVPCEVVEEDDAPLKQAQQPSTPQEGSEGPSQGGRWRVVVADDHDIVREGIIALLQDHPRIEVVGEACDGRTAIAMADQLQPDVMVMDINMPEVNGIEATHRISANSPRIRIIGLSMHEDGEAKRRMLEAGASAYVAKAGAYEDLIGAIEADQMRAAK
jgi:CheY-like chemotaxis protein